MKVQISQRYVYHKIATIEIEVNKQDYQKYLIDNKGYHSIDDYLLEHEELWLDKIDDATVNSELEFGFGLGYCSNENHNVNFNEGENESELRYDCKELKIGGHL